MGKIGERKKGKKAGGKGRKKLEEDKRMIKEGKKRSVKNVKNGGKWEEKKR